MILISWYDSIPFYFHIVSISALMLTYYDAWNWCDTSHKLHEPTRSHLLNAWFPLSLYCSWCLYSVMSRRWTNDHQLGRSSMWAGQTLIAPSKTHVSVVLPFEGKSSTAPLTIFLCWYTIFCHMFLNSFLTIGWHVWCGLGQAHLTIGLIAPPGMQVKRLVVFKL